MCAAAVGIDAQGDVVVAGALSGSMPELGLVPEHPSTDVFVAKLASGSGQLKWAKQYGANKEAKDQQGALDLALSDIGDIILAGFYDGTLEDLDSSLNAQTGRAGFVSRLDSGGSSKWAVAIPSGVSLRARAVKLDAAGDVLVLGDFEGKLSVGLDQAVVSQGDAHSFMIELAKSSGQPIRGFAFGSSGADWSQSLAVGSQGDVLMAGVLGGDIDFAGKTVEKGTANDRYLVGLNSGNKTTFARGLDTSINSNSSTSNVALATNGDRVVVAGAFKGILDHGLGQLKSAGGTDVFLAQFDDNGKPLWQISYGDSSDTGSDMRLASDGQGTIVMASTFEGAPDFGAGPLSTEGKNDVFVVKLSLPSTQ